MPSSPPRSGCSSRGGSRSSSPPRPAAPGSRPCSSRCSGFLPPGVRTIELAGAAETFDWLPQASELGWRRSRRRARRRPMPPSTPRDGAGPVRPDDTVLLHPGALGPPAVLHLGRRGAARDPGRVDRLRPGRDDPRRLARRGLRGPAPSAGAARRRRAVATRRRPRPAAGRRRVASRRRGALRPADRPRRPRPRPAPRAGRARDLGSRDRRLRALRLGRSSPSWPCASGSAPATSRSTSTAAATTSPAFGRRA